MKRETLSRAVIAGIAGIAGVTSISNAVNLNPDGTGQVLVYPHYTVNGGIQTLISVVNTTDEVKAVKVRFLESLNSREVLDFNLYLSPFDVWTAAIADADGEDTTTDPGVLFTGDQTCTVPDIVNNFPGGVPFRNFAYTGLRDDTGPSDLSRTREGHFEMIEMGEIGNTTSGSAAAATHVAGVPADCAQLNDAWRTLTDGITPAPGAYWLVDPTIDLNPPAGGLFGAASLVDGLEGLQASYNAVAVDGFWDPAALAPHTSPGTEFPSIGQATFDSDADGGINSTVFNNGNLVQSDWAFAVDAVSAMFMHDAIFNEYALDLGLDAQTNWVVTFPTKRFYVDDAFTTPAFGVGAPVAPFTDEFDFPTGGACEEFLFTFYDREEVTPGPSVGGVDFSPLPPGATPDQFILCYETNVIAYTPATSVKAHNVTGSLYLYEINGVFENGWAIYNFFGADGDGDMMVTGGEILHQLDGASTVNLIQREENGDVYAGLPVIGHAIQTLKNGTLTGDDGSSTLANYAGLFTHRASRVITDL